MGYYDNYQARSLTNLRHILQTRFYHSLFQNLKLNVASTSQVLEIGPGEGGFAKYLSKFEPKYFGVEQNESLAQKLSEEGFEVKAASTPPLPFQDNSFDFIFCFHVIEHLESPRVVFELISECKRTLKNGGVLILIAPDYMRMGKYFWDCDYTHSTVITERRMQQVFTDTGFQNFCIKGITEPFVGPIKYIINALLFFYPYCLLQFLYPFQTGKTLLYKIRSTFSQSVLAVAQKTS